MVRLERAFKVRILPCLRKLSKLNHQRGGNWRE
jgi:hypothetical protein